MSITSYFVLFINQIEGFIFPTWHQEYSWSQQFCLYEDVGEVFRDAALLIAGSEIGLKSSVGIIAAITASFLHSICSTWAPQLQGGGGVPQAYGLGDFSLPSLVELELVQVLWPPMTLMDQAKDFEGTTHNDGESLDLVFLSGQWWCDLELRKLLFLPIRVRSLSGGL